VIVGSTTADLLEHATVPVLVLPRGIARESAGAAA
jgi:nucleotide-binding universal stress UspA family protein